MQGIITIYFLVTAVIQNLQLVVTEMVLYMPVLLECEWLIDFVVFLKTGHWVLSIYELQVWLYFQLGITKSMFNNTWTWFCVFCNQVALMIQFYSTVDLSLS